MPNDIFQLSILEILSPLRTPESTVAGSSAMHQHGRRLSNDIDIFNTPKVDVVSTSDRDIKALENAGFQVDKIRTYEGFVEAIVAKETAGSTNLQWVQYHGMDFYPPVNDPEFGYRLSYADLAINKVIAAGTRREARDMLDLRFVGHTTMPLWIAINAAHGKDPHFTPIKLLNQMRRFANYSDTEIADAAIVTMPIEPRKLIARIRSELDRAEEQINNLAPGLAGKLLIDENRRYLKDAKRTHDAGGWSFREAKRGPLWPSGKDLDSMLVSRMLRHFGRHGHKLTTHKGIA